MPMQSRTDQVHAYQFFLQRVVSGMVAKESDPAEVPFRRLGWAGLGSVMLAVLIIAGFGMYGFLAGGGATSWRDGGSVIVDRDGGVVYIYRDGRLHPMTGLVSAQLALDGNPAVTRVSSASLQGVPRGTTLGIPGAPDALPGPDNLLTGGWSVCSERPPDGRGGRETVSALGIGYAPEGGSPLADGRALLVHDVDGGADARLYLVWNGHRFALVEPEPALRALGVSAHRALPVSGAWLDAVPVGDPLRPPLVADPGQPTRAFGDPAGRGPHVRTGQVLEIAGAYYLVGSATVREITPLAADLVLADPATAAAYPDGPPAVRVGLSPGVLTGAVIERLPARTTTSPPEERPELASIAPPDAHDAAVCATFQPGQFTPDVRVAARLPWAASATATGQRAEDGTVLVDYVLVTGGHAVLVQAVSSPTAAGGVWHVVTDQGLRHSLPDPAVAGRFGYDPDRGVRVPAGLVARLPAGPALDPAAATRPVESPVTTAARPAAGGG